MRKRSTGMKVDILDEDVLNFREELELHLQKLEEMDALSLKQLKEAEVPRAPISEAVDADSKSKEILDMYPFFTQEY